MTSNTCQVLLHVSPELYGRMAARAAVERFDLHDWVLHTVIGELLRPESELATNRRARTILAAMPSPTFIRPAIERKPHVPHS